MTFEIVADRDCKYFMNKEKKRYTVDYTSGATGYGWEIGVDSLAEVKSMVKHYSEYTMFFSVWDNELHDFLYYKRVLTYKPEINKL